MSSHCARGSRRKVVAELLWAVSAVPGGPRKFGSEIFLVRDSSGVGIVDVCGMYFASFRIVEVFGLVLIHDLCPFDLRGVPHLDMAPLFIVHNGPVILVESHGGDLAGSVLFLAVTCAA